MKFHRLITFIALCLILFYAAVPLGAVSAAPASRTASLQDAQLQVTITADPDLTSNNSVGFTIQVVNISPTQAENLVVEDQLDPAVTWKADNGGCSTAASGLLTCRLGSLASGKSVQVHVTGTMAIPLCGTLSSTAKAYATNALASEAVANIPTPLGCYPLLSIVKTAAASEVVGGQPVSYTLSVKNSGGIAAENVVLQDVLPVQAGLSWSIAAPVPAGCAIAAGVLTCNYGLLPKATTRSVTITSDTSAESCGKISNTATVESTNEPATKLGDNTSTADITITCPEAFNVAVTKTAAADSVNLGGLVQFTITVTNTSSAVAPDVSLSDVLPNGSGFVWSIDAPAPAECAITANTLNCNYGSLVAGATRTVTISSLAGTGSCGVVDNTASVTAVGEPPANLADNTASASVTVVCAGPNLVVTKVPDSPMVTAPGPIGYTITATNNGVSPASNIVITDQLDGALSWSETTGAACLIDGTTQLMTCTFASLAAGASVSVHVTAMASTADCGDITNTAYASATEITPPVPSEPVVVTVNCPITGVNVKIIKTAEKPVVNQGEPIIFTMVVSNDSTSTADGVVMIDTLPTVTGLSWSIVTPVPAGCAIATGVLTCDIGSLTPGQSSTVKITSPSDKTAGIITNTAIVSATNETAGNQADNTSTAKTQVPIAACLNLNLFGGKYSNNFESAKPGNIGIQNYLTSVAPKGQKFLGDYANKSVALTVGCLPPHTRLKISFDLYIIRSWDGNTEGTGPDRWRLELEGRKGQIIDTTFSEWSWSNQAYPGFFPTGDYPYRTGAKAVETLGYTYSGFHKDAIYHFDLVIPHTGEFATFKFTGFGLQPVFDESWGLDNITVEPAGQYSAYLPIFIH